MKLVFTIVEPMTLPKERIPLPFKDEEIDTANSGREVPKETIVAPMTSSAAGDLPRKKENQSGSGDIARLRPLHFYVGLRVCAFGSDFIESTDESGQ